MKFKKVIVVFAFGFFISGLLSNAFHAKKLDVLRTGMERLEKEIVKVKQSIKPFEEVKKINVKVTGYSNYSESINVPGWRKGLTATGSIAVKGTVAADWSLFKPGTSLYIPGYGFGTVEDRGGGVKGKHLDIFFDSREEALKWGVKHMDILVADKNG